MTFKNQGSMLLNFRSSDWLMVNLEHAHGTHKFSKHLAFFLTSEKIHESTVIGVLLLFCIPLYQLLDPCMGRIAPPVISNTKETCSNYNLLSIPNHTRPLYFTNKILNISHIDDYIIETSIHGPLTSYIKLMAAHAPGMPGTFSPSPRVSDPDKQHGTCVTHVPWCIPVSLTSGFLWSRWREKCSLPALPAHGQPATLRIW